MLSPNELHREARILIQKIVKKKAWLENRTETLSQKAKWVLVNARTKQSSKCQVFNTEIVEAMVRQGWLCLDPTGALVLTARQNAKSRESNKGFIQQHQLQTEKMIKDDEGRVVFASINQAENPLGWMKARKDKFGKPLIDDFQFEAGERIRVDFTIAQLSPRVTASWDFSGASGGGQNGAQGALEISEKVIAAKQRLFKAMDILGPEMSSIVLEVCCLMSGLESAEKALGWPRRSGKLVLQIALSKLSIHYGIAKADSKTVRKQAIIHWGQEGYQPRVPARSTT